MATFADLLKKTLSDGRIIIKGMENKQVEQKEIDVFKYIEIFFEKDLKDKSKRTKIFNEFKKHYDGKKLSKDQFITCIFRFKNIKQWSEKNQFIQQKKRMFKKIEVKYVDWRDSIKDIMDFANAEFE